MDLFLNALVKLEQKGGRLGTLAGILILIISTLFAIGIIIGTVVAWFKVLEYVLITFFGYTLY